MTPVSAASPKKALSFIFITLVLDVTGIGLVIPVLPGLIRDLGGVEMSKASVIGGWLSFAYASMQFVFSPILGALSDRFGRRPILLISLAGLGVDYILMSLAPALTWLFIGKLIAGIGGASFTTATAYIADISTAKTRAQNFGLVGAAFGIGFILGPAIGGFLGQLDVRAPFYFAAGLSLLNLIYGYFVLPESLHEENRRSFSWKRANPFGTFRQLAAMPKIRGLLLAYFLLFLGANSVQSTWSFFTMYRFDWPPRTVGLSLGLAGVMVGLVQGILIRRINPWLGNRRSVYTGLLFYAVGLFLFSVASQGWMMFAILVPYAFGGISGPAMQAIMAGEVAPNAQGELQAGITSLVSLTQIIGPVLMTGLFERFTRVDAPFAFPGGAFLCGAVLLLCSVWMAYLTLEKNKEHAP
jgi:DHA1 family tetracycline resistance protein-like MFS transporter